jgi:hypothetical protein
MSVPPSCERRQPILAYLPNPVPRFVLLLER